MSKLTEYLEVALFASPAPIEARASDPISEPAHFPDPAAFELLRAHEAAKIIDVSAQTIYRWMSSGLLRSFRVGRVTRVRRCDLDQFIINNLTQ